MDVMTNEQAKRFEITVEGKKSVLDYERDGDRIIFTHTGVPRELEGRGIGTALAKAGLEYAKTNGLRVVPACSFIRIYIKRHPEYEALVAGM